jgi:hypothetical protein
MKNRTSGIALLAVMLGTWVLAGCSSGPTPAEASASAAEIRAAMQVDIIYEAEGARLPYGDAMPYGNVTMKTPTGTTQSSPDFPMTNTGASTPGVKMTFQAGDFVYLSVQNNGSTEGVTCRISTAAGAVISENSSDAEYGIATCDGRAR